MWYDALHPQLQPYAAYIVEQAGAAGLAPRITSVFRTHGQQAELYRKYQQGLTRYPVAPPGRSMHEYGLAWDMVVHRPDAVGGVWRTWGGRWGGDRDPVHFDVPIAV